VLQRGRSYDDIAGLLAIDRAAVRDRALAALDALGPAETTVPPERRALITDYLLGQLPSRVRDETRERLASSPSERAWARVLASELAPIASEPLPEIPTGPLPAGPEPSTGPAPEPPAAPEPEQPPLTPEPEPATAGEPSQAPVAAPALAAPREPEPTPPRAPARPPPPGGGDLPQPVPAERPSSRLGGSALLAIAVVIAIVVVIVIVTTGGSSPKKNHANAGTRTTSTPSGTTTTTSTATTPHIVAQIALRPANTASKAAGLAEIVTEGSVTGVIVAATHLPPNTTHDAYAVWLANPNGGASHLLGYVSPGVGKSGTLKTSGPLPSNVSSYKEILVTRETTTNTKTPGQTVLSGPLSGG
jgi:hypothetical protein